MGKRVICGLQIDRTGSMTGIRMKTIESVDKYIKKLGQEAGETTLIVATFNSYTGLTVTKRGMAKTMGGFSQEEYITEGGTPLFDTMMEMIALLEAEEQILKTAGHEVGVILTVVTDGEENSSTKHSYIDVVEKTKVLRDRGWEIVFLGVDIDAFAAGEQIGISKGSTISLAASDIDNVFEMVAETTVETVCRMANGTYTSGSFFDDSDS